MGSLAAYDMAEQGVDIDVALSWHLRSNHYPPVPQAFVATCKEAIRLAQEEDWDEEVELPMGCNTCRTLLPWDSDCTSETEPGPYGIGYVILSTEVVGHEGHDIVHDAVTWKDGRDTATVAALVESFHLDAFCQ